MILYFFEPNDFPYKRRHNRYYQYYFLLEKHPGKRHTDFSIKIDAFPKLERNRH